MPDVVEGTGPLELKTAMASRSHLCRRESCPLNRAHGLLEWFTVLDETTTAPTAADRFRRILPDHGSSDANIEQVEAWSGLHERCRFEYIPGDFVTVMRAMLADKTAPGLTDYEYRSNSGTESRLSSYSPRSTCASVTKHPHPRRPRLHRPGGRYAPTFVRRER